MTPGQVFIIFWLVQALSLYVGLTLMRRGGCFGLLMAMLVQVPWIVYSVGYLHAFDGAR